MGCVRGMLMMTSLNKHMFIVLTGLLMLASGFVGFAGYSEMMHQCPGGADCADINKTFIIGTSGAVILAMASVFIGMTKKQNMGRDDA